MTDDIVVDNYALPIVDLGNDQAICQGDSLELNAQNVGATYNWSTLENSQSIFVQNAGNYTVTVTDANNCSSTDDIDLTLISPPTFDLGPDQLICPNASLTLNTNISGQTYNWSTLENTQSISVNTAGTYYVTVTNAANCSAVDSITVSYYATPIVDLGNDTTICTGSTIDLDAQNSGLNFMWSTLESNQVITVSSPDTYSVTVTDANNCTVTDDIVVDNYALPIVDLGNDQAICQGDSLELNAQNAGATYNWSTLENTQSIFVQNAGNYAVTVTDANNCSSTDDIDLTLISPPAFDLGPDQLICPNASLTLNTNISGQTYNWSTLENTQSISVNTAGTYYVTVTNAANCPAVDSITVSYYATPIVDLGNDQAICQGDSLELNAQNAGATYNWSTLENSQSIFVQNTGNYAVTVTDANNCSNTDDIWITEIPGVQTSIDSSICEGNGININGNLIFNAGIYVDSLLTFEGCDSLISINLNIDPIDSIYLDNYSCNPQDTGLFMNQDLNVSGCDSFTFIQIHLSPSNITNGTATSCDPALVGVDTTFHTNQFNCDSLHIITTTLLPSDTVYVPEQSCHLNEVGFDTLIFAGQFCDSTVIIETTFIEPDTFYINQNTCDPSAVGIQQFTDPNISGCDSITILTTTLSPLDTVYNQEFTCDQNILGLDTTYLAGTLCDTTVITEYILNTIPPVTINQSSCNPSEVGTDTIVTQTILGCDSTTYVITDLIQADTIQQQEFTCDQNLIGIDTTYLTGTLCDTTVITEYILNTIPPVTINQSSCNPMEVGTDTIVTQTLLGCDSTTYVITDLIQADTIQQQEYTCDQNLIGIDTTYLTGTLCDTTVITEYLLNIIPPVTINQSSCNPLDVGTDTIVTQTLLGCDSITYVITDLIQADTIQLQEYTCDQNLIGIDTTYLTGALCDTTIITEYLLNIIPPVTINQSSCNPSEVGTDTIVTQTLLGCDSVTYIITDLIQGDTIYQQEYICDQNLLGIDTTYLTGTTCDTTIITEYLLNIISPVTINQSSCDPTAVGMDTIITQTAQGCDSITYIITDLIPMEVITAIDYTCNPFEVGLDTTTIMGIQCDTMLITDYQLVLPTLEFLMTTTCNPNQVGNDTLFLQNQFGCDSLIITETSLVNCDFDTLYFTSCDPAEVGIISDTIFGGAMGTVITVNITSQVFGDTINISETVCDQNLIGIDSLYDQNSFGCDSLTIINYTFNFAETLNIQAYTCDPSEIGITQDTITSGVCDTLVITTTDLYDCTPVEINLETCDLDSVGIFVDTIPNQFNLDSIIITTIELSPPDTLYGTDSSCNPQDTGIIISNFNTTGDCEAVMIEYVSLLESNFETIIESSCDPSDWIDTTLIFANQFGCDSTIHFQVTPAAPITNILSNTTCDPEEIGADTLQQLITIDGCDSLVIEETTLLDMATDFQVNEIICYDGQGGIFINPGAGTPPFLYSINDSPLQENGYFGMLDPGSYDLYVEDAEGCFESETIFLSGVNEMAVRLTEDTTIDLGESVDLQAVTNMVVDTFYWNTLAPLSCMDCFDPTASPLQTRDVEITVIDTLGCEATDRMTIRVRKDKGLYVPNAFSPNDDGENDHFLVYAALSVAKVDRMQIFDRWGEMVFEITNPIPGVAADGWDGTWNGKALNPAVFVYSIDVTYIDGRKEKLSGDVTLLR